MEQHGQAQLQERAGGREGRSCAAAWIAPALGCGVWGLGCGVWGVGFWDVGFGVGGLVFEVEG